MVKVVLSAPRWDGSSGLVCPVLSWVVEWIALRNGSAYSRLPVNLVALKYCVRTMDLPVTRTDELKLMVIWLAAWRVGAKTRSTRKCRHIYKFDCVAGRAKSRSHWLGKWGRSTNLRDYLSITCGGPREVVGCDERAVSGQNQMDALT